MKQTAVDWLFQELWDTPKDKFTWHSILEEAKQMEKEQINDGYEQGYSDGYPDNGNSGEQYYQETYGKDA